MDQRFTLIVAAVACFLSLIFNLFYLWDHRDLFDPEGISYLDIADAYLRGDWKHALTGIWSPMYSWLLALVMLLFSPSAQWEFTAVHLLNVFIYLVALSSFSYFLWELLRADRERPEEFRVPDWSWITLGYSLFTWGTVQLVPLYLPEPDLLVAALLFLLFAMLLRIRKGNVTWGESITLGVLLALGYFTKAIMFPMAFVFTGIALVLTRFSRAMQLRILISFVLFVSLSFPYIAALSSVKGHWTYSEAGKLNYAWGINNVTEWIHWQGESPDHGTPLHTTRKIHDDPPVYEFATPIIATYPPWYDPSYWFDGVKVTIDLHRQVEVFLRNTGHLLLFLANSPGTAIADSRASGALAWGYEGTLGSLLALLCALILTNLGHSSPFRTCVDRWYLFLPVTAGLAAYTLLHLEGRMIVAYVVILWVLLFRWFAVPTSPESKRACTAIVAAAALTVTASLLPGTARAMWHAVRHVAEPGTHAPFFQSGHTNWKVARYLKNAGLRDGDPVGSIGYTFGAYWARMARLRVIAEIQEMDSSRFWTAGNDKKKVVMQLFRSTGAVAVVGSNVPSDLVSPGWIRIEDTNYYVYIFPHDK